MTSDRPVRHTFIAVLEHLGAEGYPSVGGWRNVRCFAHEDRQASAQVNPDDGFWRCFACDQWGDAYALIEWREGVSFRDAKQLCSEIAGDGNSSVPGAPGDSTALPGKAWYQRGSSSGRKAGGGGYTGTYSR